MKLAYKRRIFYELIGSYNGLMLIHIIHVLNFKKLNSMQRTGILQMVNLIYTKRVNMTKQVNTLHLTLSNNMKYEV